MSFSPLSNLGIIKNQNYIINSDFNNFPFASNATLGWSLKNGGTPDATTKLPTAAPSAAASGTLSLSAVSGGSQISGTVSASLSSSGITTAGDMLITDVLVLDEKARSSVQTFSFFYKIASGSTNVNLSGTSLNSLAVAIYDVTNAAWIDPAGRYNVVQSSGVGKASGTFQVPANCTSVRLAVYFPNASSGAFTVYLDDFVLGPQVVQYGAPVTDWQNYTPTLGGVGTATGVSFKYRRVGDTIQVTGLFATGTPTAAQFTISLPNAIDATKIGGTAATVGNLTRNATSFQASSIIVRTDLSTSVVYSGGQYTSAQSGLNPQNGNALFPSGETVSVEFFYPAAGLSSSVQMSNDTDTRVVAAKASYSTAAVVALTAANYTKVNLTLIEKDTHGTVNLTNDDWVCPVSGTYVVTAKVRASQSAGSQTIEVYAGKNASPGALLLGSATITTADSQLVFGARQIDLVAGDTISLQIYAPAANGRYDAFTTLELYRLSGPATIAASESVQAKYWASANGTTNTTTPVNFDSKVYDSHNAVTTGAAWKFTAPVSGKYQVNAFLNSSAVPSNNVYIVVYKNASTSESISYMPISPGTNTAAGIVEMNAGEFIDIRTNANWPWFGSVSRAGNGCLISISRVGN